ncbi:MAG: 50S ribosomal protein L10 [Candidatus Thermochlorobacter sp.]
MKRPEKEQVVEKVAEKMKRATAFYLTEFQGMTVAQTQELRNELRKSGIEYKVVKNTLIKKAIEHAQLSDKLFPALKNTTAIAFGYDDPIAPAKILKKFSEGNDKLKFKGASVEGQVFDHTQLAKIAAMTNKVENIGKALGIINQTIAGVPMTINAVMRNLVNVLDQIAKQKAASAQT